MAETNEHEKSPLKSKKFIAFLVFTLAVKLLFVVVIAWMWDLDEMDMRPFILLMALVILDGFVTTGFILGQAGLDRFVRLAHIAADLAKNGNGNGMATTVFSEGTRGMVEVSATSESDPTPA